MSASKYFSPQIKICGLTLPEEAARCAALGADAIGLVFYPPSPRHLDITRAVEVAAALPSTVCAVGVFVDPQWELLTEAIQRCRLGAVQLHGNESPDLVEQLTGLPGLKVIKTLFAARTPRLEESERYPAGAFLVECGLGRQPGGNAESWEWQRAADLARRHTVLLAGGLTPQNVGQAVAAALPAAVDASSGLEHSPGRKDLRKVEQFIGAVRRTRELYRRSGIRLRPVFE